jgi:hypothetical protein
MFSFTPTTPAGLSTCSYGKDTIWRQLPQSSLTPLFTYLRKGRIRGVRARGVRGRDRIRGVRVRGVRGSDRVRVRGIYKDRVGQG